MSRTITVTSTHHWSHAVKVELIVDKENLVDVKWFIDHDKSVTMNDAAHDVNLFILLFEQLYSTFGVIEDLTIVGGTYKEVYRHLYNLPVPSELQLKVVRLSTCGCNMGYCGAIVDYTIHKVKTIEDLLKIIEIPYKHCDRCQCCICLKTAGAPDHYYEYPDSVVLFVDKLTELPAIVDTYPHDNIIKAITQLEPGYNYISLSYGR
jgi:hypothetical protein